MTDAIQKSVTLKYSQTGLNQMTREMETYNRATHKLTKDFQRFDDVNKIWITNKTVTKDATKNMGLYGNSLNTVIGRFFGVGAAIGMSIKAFQELQHWVTEGIKSFRAFEYRMAEVSSILTQQTRNILPQLEIGITNLSIKYGKSVDDLTGGLYEIISAAFDVKDAMSLLNVVTKASIAGMTNVQGAVRTFTGVLNAYGQSTAYAAELSDKLFEAVVRGNFTFSQLESSLGYVVPIAAEAGIAFDEIAASMMSATRQGQHIDSVTRGLGLLIQNIINPTKEASEAARKYGIDMTATALRVNGLTGFLNQLAAATDKYGSQILPELIGNMRSLRVAMALTSESGIKGFSDDMDALTTSTGRTDEAMQQIMETQQKMADIIEQTMQRVNRSIGEAWSGFDLWWKKAQVWWGTLFSGGDANKAVEAINNAIRDINKAYVMGSKVSKPEEGGLYKKLFGGELPETTKEIQNLIMTTSRFNDIKDYMDVEKELEDYNKQLSVLDNTDKALKVLQEDFSKTIPYEKMGEGLTGRIIDEDMLKVANEGLKTLGIQTIELTDDFGELYNTRIPKYISDIGTKTTETNGKIAELEITEQQLRPVIDELTVTFEKARAAMTKYDENIITIKSDIDKLSDSIPDLQQKLLELITATPLERFEHFASLAADYGEKYINEFTNVFDEYGNNMQNVIMTIYKYNEALKEEKKVTEEVEKANRDLEIAMARNNLEMLKIQLAGMMRRRGNTRAEQRQMKQLEIENTKLRIQQMQEELKEKEAIDRDGLDEKKNAADAAQAILNEYLAAERHNLWMIEDTRDEDIQDLKDTITEQEDLLNDRKTMLETQTTDLAKLEAKYNKIIKSFSGTKYEEAFETSGTEISPPISMASPEFQAMIRADERNPTRFGYIGRKYGKNYQGGTQYVPETGFYKLHKYETVSPAGKEISSGGGNITVHINNPQISSDYDVAKMARSLENVLRANLIDKRTGKNKYRLI